MKKFFYTLVACVALLALLTGCATETPGNTQNSTESNFIPSNSVLNNLEDDEKASILEGIRVPEIKEDYFEMTFDNCNLTMYRGNGGYNGFEVWLFSAKDLAGQTVDVVTDIGGSCSFLIPEPSEDDVIVPEKISFETFLAYQGLSPADLTEDKSVADRYKTAYSLIVDDVRRLFQYRVSLSFPSLGIDMEAEESQKIETLSVTVGEQTKKYEVKNMVVLPGSATLPYGGGLSNRNGIGPFPIPPSPKGIVTLPEALCFRASEDMVLEGLKFIDLADVAFECELVVRPETGGMYNLTWDGASPLDIDANSEISMSITFEDPSLAGALTGSVMRYMAIHYRLNGEQFGLSTQLIYFLSTDPHELYASKVDGVDIFKQKG